MEEEATELCKNCENKFPKSKIDLHEAYCLRNIIKCQKCK